MKESGMSKTAAVVITAIIAAVVVGLIVFFAVPRGKTEGGGEITQSDVESFLGTASPEALEKLAKNNISQEILSAVSKTPRKVTIGAEWFSIIEGTTWTYQCQKALDWLPRSLSRRE
jgi:hypothetical protein